MKKRWRAAGEGHDFKAQNMLFTTGPFAYSRNPIYLGSLLMLFGLGIALRTYLVVIAIYPLWFFSKSIKHEEALLEKHFGKKYLLYKAKVRRFL
jgi:protein-S-isoprenylcysteine O-methyltransferase Ste14